MSNDNKLSVAEYNVLVQLTDLGTKQLGLQLFTSEAGDVLKSALAKLGTFVDVPAEVVEETKE